MTDRKALQVEIHIPFCKGHCVFCHEACLGQNIGYLHRYLRALEKEIEGAAGDLTEYHADTVFLRCDGLSLLGAGALDNFLSKLKEAFPDKEIAWAATLLPDEVNEEMLYVLSERCGIKTVLLRMMALSREELAALHAPFTQNLVQQVFDRRRLQVADCRTVLELLTGIPGQSREHLREGLERAVSLNPVQVSLRRFHNRHLTEEEQLSYARETDWTGLAEEACAVLEKAGLERRGKSLHFARPGCALLLPGEERMEADVMGFGLGAFTRMDGISYRNTTDYALYTEHADEPDVIAVL